MFYSNILQTIKDGSFDYSAYQQKSIKAIKSTDTVEAITFGVVYYVDNESTPMLHSLFTFRNTGEMEVDYCAKNGCHHAVFDGEVMITSQEFNAIADEYKRLISSNIIFGNRFDKNETRYFSTGEHEYYGFDFYGIKFAGNDGICVPSSEHGFDVLSIVRDDILNVLDKIGDDMHRFVSWIRTT